MLAGVGKLLSNFKSYYNEINSATLTGAIDVVVVEQPDGSYQSSPFHVRFGKLGVIRSREKVVYIEINGEATDLQMKLGPHGEAFFVQGLQDKWEGPDYMATSPIPSSPLSEAMNSASKSDTSLEKSRRTRGNKSHTQRVRHETEQSHSSSSSASDLSHTGATANKMGGGVGKATTRGSSFSFKPINQEEDEMLESGGMFDIEVSDDDCKIPIPDLHSGLSKAVSLPLIQESSINRTENWALSNYHKSSQFHPFSDTDITPLVSPVGSRPHTPKSDTECELTAADRKRKSGAAGSSTDAELRQWNWGELPASSQQVSGVQLEEGAGVPTADDVITQAAHPGTDQTDKAPQYGSLWSFMRSTKTIRHKPEQEGIYLDDLNLREMDPEMAALYFPKNQLKTAEVEDLEAANIASVHAAKDDDVESGNGASLPHSPDVLSLEDRTVASPTSETGTMRDQEYLMYGDIAMSLCGGVIENFTEVPTELFNQYLITYDSMCEKPTEMLQHPDLVIRIGNKFYNWAAASPMIMSMMCFHQTLPEEAQDNLIKSTLNKKQKAGRSSSWWPFSRGAAKDNTDVESGSAKSPNSTPNGSPRKPAHLPQAMSSSERHSESGDEADDEKEKITDTGLSPLSVDTTPHTTADPVPVPSHYVKTLRLTTEEIENLNLHDGQNEIEFSVTTAYQGTSRCLAHIYLWKHTDKVIISDIDGTITKSDVLGQILPMVGKDWSQSGVTQLYTKIAQNGYKFAYLSARAIGQAQITRDYLKTVKQGELYLPPGPLFLNPSSLINAFHKEVIEKKPETFKISCMSDIKSLFSHDCPLSAGFGNRINDIYAYRAVGIPKSRIFLIDTQGKVKTDFSETFSSSYSHLSDVTDHYFPPIEEVGNDVMFHSPAEYSNFTYWRDPLPSVSAVEITPQ